MSVFKEVYNPAWGSVHLERGELRFQFTMVVGPSIEVACVLVQCTRQEAATITFLPWRTATGG